MKISILLIALFVIFTSESSHAAPTCGGFFEKLNSLPGVQFSSKAVGLAIGASNDVLVTIAHGSELIPKTLGPWLPLANEFANVASTATGKTWIYSGMSKQIADGVALGSILGHSLTATANHGPMTGALTLAANLGLTFWFPNKYFHSLMHGIPELIPSSTPKLKKFASSGIGQGLIGVSLIVIIEQLLHKSELLAEKAPHAFSHKKKEKDLNEDIRKASAAFLIDGLLVEMTDKEAHEKLLQYILGITKEEGLFSFSEQNSAPPAVSLSVRKRASEISHLDLKSKCGNLLTEDEVRAVKLRLIELLK